MVIKDRIARFFLKGMRSFNIDVSSVMGGIANWPDVNKQKHIDNFKTNIDVYRVITMVTDAIKKIMIIVNTGHGEDTKRVEDNDYIKFLEQPNRWQGWAAFVTSAIATKMITGDRFLYFPSHSEGGNRGRPSEMFVLPTQDMAIKADKHGNVIVYEQTIGGKIVLRKPEEIVHSKEFNPDPNSLFGMSKLFPGSRTVAVSDESQTYQKKALQNGAPPGFISYDGTKALIGTQQRSGYLESWKEDYTGAKNAGKTPWLNFPAEYHQMGLSPVDLETIASQRHAIDGIAGLYNVPPELVNIMAKQSYQSPREAWKALYTMAAIPELLQLLEALNKDISPLFGDVWAWYDTSKIEVLQVDKKAQAEWLVNAWWLTPNQRLEIMSLPIDEKTQGMDEIWVPSSLLPMGEEDISKPIKE